MEENNKRKWQIRAAILVIFLLGFLAGALTLNVYNRQRFSFQRGVGGRERYEQMINRLNLTKEQRAQVDQIMKDARSRMIQIRKQSEPLVGEVRQQTDERMKAALTPEQWRQWRQMTNEMRERRRERSQ